MKRFEMRVDPLTQEVFYAIGTKGYSLMEDPLLNKGSAFTNSERVEFGLTGLLAESVGTLDMQLARAYGNYQAKSTDMERYITLMGLLDRNETLFYALLTKHISEMLPIVYTPTVGQACLKMSHIIRRYRGLYVSENNIHSAEEMLHNVGLPDVSLIVVTDGERILGLGDLGVDGMGIPIGKLALYVAAAGIHPASTLPICLDVGTNNERLLNDPIYIGTRKPRMTGDAYYDFIERFVQGVRRVYPRALLQWEDFGKSNAFNLLHRYQNRLPSFNDDIQGTGATAASALLTAKKITGRKLSDERIAILGFGQAGSGVANAIATSIEREEGLSIEEARKNIYPVDINGLLLEGMEVEPHQQYFVHAQAEIANWKFDKSRPPQLQDVIENAKITVLIGLSAQTGIFDQHILESVGKNSDRPIVFALSNPTSRSETTPEAIATATNGRALMGFGSPFTPFDYGNFHHPCTQCNNLYIFPGVGLGAIVAQATKVTPRMFYAASKALSELVSAEERAKNMLLPGLDDIRHVSFEVALAVGKQAREDGIGVDISDVRLAQLLRDAMWEPHYYNYRFTRY